MKFSDVVALVGAADNKDVRKIIKELGLNISEKARTVPDEYVDQIKEAYAAAHAPLIRRSVAGDSSQDIVPTKEEMREITSEKELKEVKRKKPSPKKKKEEPKIDDKLEIEQEAIQEDDVSDTVLEEEMYEEKFFQRRDKVRIKKKKEHIQKDVPVMAPKDNAVIPEVITVKEFAEKIGIPSSKIIAELLKNGIIVTINHKIDFDTASLIASEFGLTIAQEETEFGVSDIMKGNLSKLLENENPDTLEMRPPVVSIMGHVDHGKTSLLDFIRSSKVVDSEAGGITQHIGAYQVEVNDRKITFLDTPGHEAFTAMRARGAKATDIAILVVAADEGVKPQTEEAINHAKEAGIPIIVAINKIDKEGANIEKVKGELAERNLVPEDWGGNTTMVPLSAKTGEGIDALLDMVLLVADMTEFKANPNRSALGTIIESHLDPQLGPVSTVLVNTGTLHIMDNVYVGEAHGRIKVMQNSRGKRLKEAGPSMPVRIAGLSETPQVGDILQVVKNEKIAREKALEIAALKAKSQKSSASSFADLITRFSKGELKQLKIVLKADTKGSLEAVRNALMKLATEEVEVSIIHSGVGNITETDVLMSSASDGLLIGFNVSSSAQVTKTAESMGVTVKVYRVIYHLTDEITKLLSGLLDPEIREVNLGDFTIMKLFYTSRKFLILGGKVTKGKIENKAEVRVIRGDKLVGTGTIDSLQKNQESVSTVAEGHECGVKFTGNCKPEEGDILEVFKIERIERSL